MFTLLPVSVNCFEVKSSFLFLVRLSHVQLKGNIQEILEKNVRDAEGKALDVEQLLQRLYTYGALKTMGSKQLLHEVSQVLSKAIKYRGKEKK